MSDFFQNHDFPTLFFVLVVIIFFVMLYCFFRKPEKIKEIGSFGLAFCVAYSLYGFIPALGALEASNGDVAPYLIYSALKIMVFQILCGLVLYLISTLAKIAMKH